MLEQGSWHPHAAWKTSLVYWSGAEQPYAHADVRQRYVQLATITEVNRLLEIRISSVQSALELRVAALEQGVSSLQSSLARRIAELERAFAKKDAEMTDLKAELWAELQRSKSGIDALAEKLRAELAIVTQTSKAASQELGKPQRNAEQDIQNKWGGITMNVDVCQSVTVPAPASHPRKEDCEVGQSGGEGKEAEVAQSGRGSQPDAEVQGLRAEINNLVRQLREELSERAQGEGGRLGFEGKESSAGSAQSEAQVLKAELAELRRGLHPEVLKTELGLDTLAGQLREETGQSAQREGQGGEPGPWTQDLDNIIAEAVQKRMAELDRKLVRANEDAEAWQRRFDGLSSELMNLKTEHEASRSVDKKIPVAQHDDEEDVDSAHLQAQLQRDQKQKQQEKALAQLDRKQHRQQQQQDDLKAQSQQQLEMLERLEASLAVKDLSDRRRRALEKAKATLVKAMRATRPLRLEQSHSLEEFLAAEDSEDEVEFRKFLESHEDPPKVSPSGTLLRHSRSPASIRPKSASASGRPTSAAGVRAAR